MVIEWDALIIEMLGLATIIYGAIFLERLIDKRKQKLQEKQNVQRTFKFVAVDLKKKLRFIDDTIKYKDFKPFFTDMWDAVIMGGRQAILPFETFESLQHTYSWMKYYNNELEQTHEDDAKETLMETLNEVRGSIKLSLQLIE
jgi:hypothetical protein